MGVQAVTSPASKPDDVTASSAEHGRKAGVQAGRPSSDTRAKIVAPINVGKPRKKIAQKQIELRARLWPWATDAHLWQRTKHDGFSTMPRTMPLIMSILDDMAGERVGPTYLELWSRAYDECFVTLSKPREMAFHAGFDGQRGERTWRQRLKKLADLGFIYVLEGSSGPMTYALIVNPYLVIRRAHAKKAHGIRADKLNALLERAGEIGAGDMDLPDPWEPAPTSQASDDPSGAQPTA